LKRFLLRWVCVFLLLFAQQVALTHAASHIHGSSPTHQGDGKGKVSFQGGLCGLHGAFSQVLGGVQISPMVSLAQDCVAERVAQQPGLYRAVESLTPPSRAPPVLL